MSISTSLGFIFVLGAVGALADQAVEMAIDYSGEQQKIVSAAMRGDFATLENIKKNSVICAHGKAIIGQAGVGSKLDCNNQ